MPFFEPCFGAVATAKVNLLKPQQQQDFGCKADCRCVLQKTPSLLTVFLSQVWNEASYILENRDLLDLPRAYLKAVKQSSEIQQRSVGCVLNGLVVVKLFLCHIILYL